MMYPPIWISMSKSTGGTYSTGCQMLGSPTFGPGKGNKSLFNDGRWKLPSTVSWKEADHSFSLSLSLSLFLSSSSLSQGKGTTWRVPNTRFLTQCVRSFYTEWEPGMRESQTDHKANNDEAENGPWKESISLYATFTQKKGKKKKKSHAYPSFSDNDDDDDTRSVHRHRRFRNHRSISNFPLERDFRKTGKNARNECFPEEKEPRNFRRIVPRRSFSSSSFASSVANRQTEGEFSIPRKFRTKGQCTYVSSSSPSLPRAPLV